MKKKIVYIGGFKLPDKNAAAQRVLNVGKIFISLNYNVIYLGANFEASTQIRKVENQKNMYFLNKRESKYQNIMSFLYPKYEIQMILNLKNIEYVIFYNLPVIPMIILKIICNKKRIKCIADITEWYNSSDYTFPRNIIKYLDTTIRMRYVHKRLTGIICISNYLFQYYLKNKKVYLPGMIDIKEDKWKWETQEHNKNLVITYVGNPGINYSKERIDLVIEAINIINSIQKEKIQFKIIGDFKLENNTLDENIKFLGKLSHEKAILEIKTSDFTIIPRENKLNIRAGFPTKLGESLACGIPVITTIYGDESKYITNEENGVILEECSLDKIISCLKKISRYSKTKIRVMKQNASISSIKLDILFYKKNLENFLKDLN